MSTTDKKTILFVLPFLPFPMESGGHQALFNGIAAVKDDFNVLVAYRATDDKKHKQAAEGFLQRVPEATLLPCYNVVWRENFVQKVKRHLKSLLRYGQKGVSVDPEKQRIEAMLQWWKSTITPSDAEWVEYINKVCREHHVDIAQVEMPWRVSDVFAIPDGVKKMYVHHELGFVRRELEVSQMKKDFYVESCRRFTDMNEIMQLNEYDEVVTLSPIDSEKLIAAGVTVPVCSSFAIVDTTLPPEADKGDGKRLTFIGPSEHDPNLVGITWFLENCWGTLKQQIPDLQFDIVGKWAEKYIEEFTQKYPGVHFLGFVDSLRDAIKDSTLIVPITIGSGIRMKILEASNIGVPFVSTHVGAEGIPVESGKHCLLADTPETFVESIQKLQDANLRQQFTTNAYQMVQEHYSLAALRKNRLSIYEDVLAAK